VRIAPADYVLAPTPPPDVDVDAWLDSLRLLRQWQPEHLAITHFGSFDDVATHLDAIQRSLELAARRAKELTVEEFVAATAAEVATAGDAETVAAYTLGAPLDQTYAGLARYWRKREEAAA
jgi:hypothetical protein